VLQPLKTKLIICPSIIANSDYLIARYRRVFVPCGDVVLAGVDNKGWDKPPSSIDTLDHCNPLTLA